MANPKKAVVISNCQCLPIASALTTFSDTTLFDFWGVHVTSPTSRGREIDEFVARARSEFDLILSIPLSEDFGPLATKNISRSFSAPVIKISNIFFGGLHPDLCYIGELGSRVIGPMGDYHSKLCLYGYLNAMSLDDIIKLYCVDNYEKGGYFDYYGASLRELERRDVEVDIPISDILPDLLRKHLCFYTINHPASFLISEYSKVIINYLQKLGLGKSAGLPYDMNYCTNSLADNVIFPIYSEIAEYHKLADFGSYRFKPNGWQVNSLSLKDFVAREHAALQAVRPEELRDSYTGQDIVRTLNLR